MDLFSFFRRRRAEPVTRSPLESIALTWRETAGPFATLTDWQTVAYCLVVCRRVQPLYDDFLRRLGRGSGDVLMRIRELLAGFLRERSVSEADRERLEREIYALHEPEDEDLAEEADAIEAVASHASALDVLARGKEQGLWLMDACFTISDRRAWGIVMPGGGLVTPELEALVRESEPMRREREWQKALIADLTETSSADEVEAIAKRFLETSHW